MPWHIGDTIAITLCWKPWKMVVAYIWSNMCRCFFQISWQILVYQSSMKNQQPKKKGGHRVVWAPRPAVDAGIQVRPQQGVGGHTPIADWKQVILEKQRLNFSLGFGWKTTTARKNSNLAWSLYALDRMDKHAKSIWCCQVGGTLSTWQMVFWPPNRQKRIQITLDAKIPVDEWKRTVVRCLLHASLETYHNAF